MYIFIEILFASAPPSFPLPPCPSEPPILKKNIPRHGEAQGPPPPFDDESKKKKNLRIKMYDAINPSHTKNHCARISESTVESISSKGVKREEIGNKSKIDCSTQRLERIATVVRRARSRFLRFSWQVDGPNASSKQQKGES